MGTEERATTAVTDLTDLPGVRSERSDPPKVTTNPPKRPAFRALLSSRRGPRGVWSANGGLEHPSEGMSSQVTWSRIRARLIEARHHVTSTWGSSSIVRPSRVRSRKSEKVYAPLTCESSNPTGAKSSARLFFHLPRLTRTGELQIPHTGQNARRPFTGRVVCLPSARPFALPCAPTADGCSPRGQEYLARPNFRVLRCRGSTMLYAASRCDDGSRARGGQLCLRKRSVEGLVDACASPQSSQMQACLRGSPSRRRAGRGPPALACSITT
jgi:hypothetical protein